MADQFTVAVNVDGRFGVDAEFPEAEVFDFFHAKVLSEVGAGEEGSDFQAREIANKTEIELAVGHFGARSDAKAASVTRAVGGDGDENMLLERLAIDGEQDFGRLVVQQRREERQDVSAIGAPERREQIRATGNVGVDAEVGDVGKEVDSGWWTVDGAEIDGSDVVTFGDKTLPGCQCRFWILDAERRREVVAAADGDVEEGDLQLVQLAQVAVNGAVAAEDEGSIEVRFQFVEPVDLDTFAKRSETTLWHVGLEDGGDVQALKTTVGSDELSVMKLEQLQNCYPLQQPANSQR